MRTTSRDNNIQQYIQLCNGHQQFINQSLRVLEEEHRNVFTLLQDRTNQTNRHFRNYQNTTYTPSNVNNLNYYDNDWFSLPYERRTRTTPYNTNFNSTRRSNNFENIQGDTFTRQSMFNSNTTSHVRPRTNTSNFSQHTHYNENTSQTTPRLRTPIIMSYSLIHPTNNTTDNTHNTQNNNTTNRNSFINRNLTNEQAVSLFRNILENPMSIFNNNFDFLDSVPIAPTQVQIDNAVEPVLLSELDETHNICPIGLNVFTATDELIRIKHCRHTFIKDNLLRWFQNSPKCPVCRYDIRDYSSQTNEYNNDDGVNNENINEQIHQNSNSIPQADISLEYNFTYEPETDVSANITIQIPGDTTINDSSLNNTFNTVV
jgi:hypothetical protein